MAVAKPVFIASRWLNYNRSTTIGSITTADNIPITADPATNPNLILVFQVDEEKGPYPSQYKVQWQNLTDGGSMADLAATGEVNYSATTDLTQGTAVTSKACTASGASGSGWQDGEEVEGASLSDSINLADEKYTEIHFAINISGAGAEDTYAFQLYEAAGSSVITGSTATLTIAPAAGTTVLDDFNRANATTLGANWTLMHRWSGSSEQFGVSSGQLYLASSSAASYYWNPATYGPNTGVTLTFRTVGSAVAGILFRLYARMNDVGAGSEDGYCAAADWVSGANNDTWYIYRCDNGVRTALGDYATGPDVVNNDTIKFVASGSDLSIYRRAAGGTFSLIRTYSGDTTYTGAGYLGFDGPANWSDWRYDNFDVVTVSGTTALTVADSRSTSASKPLVIGQKGLLAVPDSKSLSTSQAVVLVQKGPPLVVADSRSTSASPLLLLSQKGLLVVPDSKSASTAKPLVLGQSIAITVEDSKSASTAKPLVLTQGIAITVPDARSTSTAQEIILNQKGVLAVEDSGSTSTARAIPLGEAGYLTVFDSRSASASSNVVPAQIRPVLVVNDARSVSATSSHHIEALTTPAGVPITTPSGEPITARISASYIVLQLLSSLLSVQDARSLSGAQTFSLSQAVPLTVADSISSSAHQPATLLQTHYLLPQDATSASVAQPLALVQQHRVMAQDARSSSTAAGVSFGVSQVLDVQDGQSLSAAQSLSLAQRLALTTDDSKSLSSTTGPFSLPQGHLLIPAASVSSSTATAIALSGRQILDVQDGQSLSATKSLNLAQRLALTTDDARSASTVQAGTVWQKHKLTVSDARSTSTAKALSLVLSANNFTTDPNCVALYRMENNALTVDSIGTNTLTNSGVTNVLSEAKEGSACANYDALTDTLLRLDSDLSAGFPFKDGDTNKKISICHWQKVSAFPENTTRDTIYKSSGAGTRSFRLYYEFGTSWTFKFQLSSTGDTFDETIDSGLTIQPGRWYHIGWTFDNSTKAYQIRIWDDTARAVVANVSGTTTNNMAADTGQFVIGHVSSAVGGFKDEVVVFKDILAVSEIDAIRSATYTGPEALTVADARSTSAAPQIVLSQKGLLVVPDSKSASTAKPLVLGQSIALAAVDAKSASLAPQVSLVQMHGLATDDSRSPTATQPLLLQQHVFLAVSDAASASTCSTALLAEASKLVPTDSRSASACGVVTLVETVQTVSLTIADARSVSASQSFLLTQAQILATQDARSASAAKPLVLATAGLLIVDDSRSLSLAGQVSLSFNKITINDSRSVSATSSDRMEALRDQDGEIITDRWGDPVIGRVNYSDIVLAQGVTIPADDSRSVSASSVPTLTGQGFLAVNDALSSSISEGVNLVQAGVLTVADARSTSAAKPVALGETVSLITLVVTDSRSTSATETPSLAQNHVLTVEDARSSSTTETPDLVTQGRLNVADLQSASATEPVVITQKQTLIVQDSLSSSTLASPLVAVVLTLVPVDARSASSVEALVLIQWQVLTVSDARSATSAEDINLTQGQELVVQDALSTSTEETLSLRTAGLLVTEDMLSASTAQSLGTFSQTTLLVPNDSRSASSAQPVELAQHHVLSVQDERSASAASPVVFTVVGIATGKASLAGRNLKIILDIRRPILSFEVHNGTVSFKAWRSMQFEMYHADVSFKERLVTL